MTFDELNLNTPLRNALSDMGYVYPTPIQEESYSVILSGKDVIGIAQTGTGKTFAYLLPLLKQLKHSEQRHPRILIVVPTRELVLQVIEEIEKLTKYINIRFAGIYGGTNINTQAQLVYNGLDILVATPGRLIDLTMKGILRLKSIQKLVIDEVDEMLDLGFRHQIDNFIDKLPPIRQNLMFSATFTDDVKDVMESFLRETVKIEIARTGTPIEKIKQLAYQVPNYNTKLNLIEHLLKNEEELSRVLIFVDNKKLADNLHSKLDAKFENQVGVLHSNKSQNFRINTLKRIKTNEIRILIATDVIARGLDIKDITHVINFDIPDVPRNYIHRIGRTGRADKEGIAISLISEFEEENQTKIEELMKKEIHIEPIPKEVEVSYAYTDEERPKLYDKTYLKIKKSKPQDGAFHEKSEKNKQQNSGSPSKKRKRRK